MYLGGSRRWVPRPVVSSCAQIVLQYFFLIAAHYYKRIPSKRVCYISEMSPSLKSIRKLKKDLKRVNIIFINSENNLGSSADN